MTADATEHTPWAREPLARDWVVGERQRRSAPGPPQGSLHRSRGKGVAIPEGPIP